MRPFVVFEPAEGKDFRVRNLGNNTALNVRVVPFELFPPVMAHFPRSVPFLHQGEARPLQERTLRVDGEVVNDDFQFEILRPMDALAREGEEHFRPTITVEFENVNGQRYFVRESLLNGDIEILGSGPVVPPASSTVRSARQQLQPLWPKLRLVWQQLQSIRQKLQTAWRQRWRQRNGINVRTVNEDKEWVDGR
ncbi:MAG TPA: hypothetical protein VKJ47_10980 [Candidatus Binatia bacterium]|nr:hypothetical protein [Candidatus Binatia bacterium]